MKIPPNIRYISSYSFFFSTITNIIIESFSLCKKLRRIEFAEDSQLQIIEEDAFAHSQIASICIPKHVTQIKENAFYECYNLQIIEVAEQSSITRETLNDFYCKFVMVPKSLKKQFLSNL